MQGSGVSGGLETDEPGEDGHLVGEVLDELGGPGIGAADPFDWVRVEFAEGGSDEGDLLVGADGVGSAVRRTLVPHATLDDVGLRFPAGGRVGLSDDHPRRDEGASRHPG
jgi:hypothetical protein